MHLYTNTKKSSGSHLCRKNKSDIDSASKEYGLTPVAATVSKGCRRSSATKHCLYRFNSKIDLREESADCAETSGEGDVSGGSIPFQNIQQMTALVGDIHFALPPEYDQ